MMHTPKIPMLLIATMLAACLLNDSSYATETPLNSASDKINYAIGVEVARNYRNQGLELDPELVLKGMRDGSSGAKLLLSEKELRSVLISVQSEIRRKQALTRKPAASSSQISGKTDK